MLLNLLTLFIGLLFFPLCESMSFTPSYTFPEMSTQPCIAKMKSHNFQHILSWELNSSVTMPTHYTVLYTLMSSDNEWNYTEGCTNITKLSCDMTDIFEVNETYYIKLIVFKGKKILIDCVKEFFPITDTILDPPEVGIWGFKDSINVTVHCPASLSKIKNKEKELFSSVAIKVESSNTLNKVLHVNMYGEETSLIVDSLIPTANYCISAHWDFQSLKTPPAIKCIILSPSQESGSEKIIEISVIFCVIIFLIIATSVVVLKEAGYMCRKKKHYPQALDFSNVLHCPPLQLPSEKNNVTHITYIKTKKNKMCNGKSDRDCESIKRIPNGYTMTSLPCISLRQDSTFICKEYDPTDSNSEPESPEMDPPPSDIDNATSIQLNACPDESQMSHFWHNLSEGRTSSSDSKNCFNFNVNLNSVFVRDPGDDEASEEDTAQILFPEQENKINLMDSDRTELKLLTHGTCIKSPLFHGLSEENFESEDASSDESVTSESNVNLGDGYLRR